MRKALMTPLISRHSDKRRAVGFTLVEMLVSIGVLALALSVVGVVFTATARTTTQAAAYSETLNWVRQFTRQIEEDLKYCEPANSVLVMQGRTQAAALTRDDLDGGRFYRVLVGDADAVNAFDPAYDNNAGGPEVTQYSDPRADLLMFYTMRPSVSQAPPRSPSTLQGRKYLAGARFAPVQVVYGHAALGEPVWNGSVYQFPAVGDLRHIEQDVGGGTDPLSLSRIPAVQWHLSRRATILEPTTGTGSSDLRFTPEEFSRIRRCYSSRDDRAGDVAVLNYDAYMSGFQPLVSPGPGFSGQIRDGIALANPYEFTSGLGWNSTARSLILETMYAGGGEALHHVSTVLPNPPADLRTNLGVHLLPGCVWFQVEFLMPEDPRNSIQYSGPVSDPTGVISRRYDVPRWTAIDPGETYVFVPDSPENRALIAERNDQPRLSDFALLDPTQPASFDNRVIRTWPYAIRITVRAMDDQGRLETPIVRSIVHRFE